MNEGATINYPTFGGGPFQTTLPPMHQFNKYPDAMIGMQGTVVQSTVMLTAMTPDGNYQFLQTAPPEQSPPRITQLTSSVPISPTKYSSMMWDGVPFIQTIDNNKLLMPSQPWRVDYGDQHDLGKVVIIKEEDDKTLDGKLWGEAPEYTELNTAELATPVQMATLVQPATPLQLAPAQQINQHVLLDSTEDMKPIMLEPFPAPEPPQNGKKKRTRKTKVKEKKPKYRPGDIKISVAPDGSAVYKCPECNQSYSDRAVLDAHISTHKPERRFPCTVCTAVLKRKEHLDQHMRGHSTERPFICSVCGKGFKRNEHLTRHHITHTGAKDFECVDCHKRFARKDHLNKHTQTHLAKQMKAEMALQQQPPEQQSHTPDMMMIV